MVHALSKLNYNGGSIDIRRFILTGCIELMSGADIIVKATERIAPREASAPRIAQVVDKDALYDSLYRLNSALFPSINKNDRAILLITACISQGANVRSVIIGMLSGLGLNPSHVAVILRRETGTILGRARWRIESDGTYSLIE